MYSVVHVAELPNVVADEIFEITKEDDMFSDFDELLELNKLFAGDYDEDFEFESEPGDDSVADCIESRSSYHTAA